MRNLVNEIVADKKVSKEEVAKLKEVVFADGKVSKEEVEMLFEVKEKTTSQHASFATLLVDSVVAYALMDDTTPGVVSKEEGDFISSLITSDGLVDDTEKAVLVGLKKATSIESEALNILIQSI